MLFMDTLKSLFRVVLLLLLLFTCFALFRSSTGEERLAGAVRVVRAQKGRGPVLARLLEEEKGARGSGHYP